MSSYLNFYLVPKKDKEQTEDPKPLRFISYSRNSAVYQYYDELPVTYIGNGDKPNYTEISSQDADRVVSDVKETIERVTKLLQTKTEVLQNLPNIPKETMDDYIQDYTSTKTYIEELKEDLCKLESIASWIKGLEFSDFEKVLANID